MTVTDPATERGASVVPIPPPLYYGAAFAIGLGLSVLVAPLPMGEPGLRIPLSAAALAGGVVLAGAGVLAVLRGKTTIVPHRPVARLLTTGVYRFSRNPMYAGLALAYLGVAGLVGDWWLVLTLPAALLAIQGVVIGPEERYLAAHFGPRFAYYRLHVRRWL